MPPKKTSIPIEGYDSIVSELVGLVERARHVSARSVKACMGGTYWEMGRRMVEFEERGKKRAEYGEALLERLAADLTVRFGRGFGRANLAQMRKFFLTWPQSNIVQTVSGQFEESQSGSPLFPVVQTLSGESQEAQPLMARRWFTRRFPLPWSHYVRLMTVSREEARKFYEVEAAPCGWSVPQLDPQISSQFYERPPLSPTKKAM